MAKSLVRLCQTILHPGAALSSQRSINQDIAFWVRKMPEFDLFSSMEDRVQPTEIPAQERRDSERVARVALCPYELTTFSSSASVDLSEGHAITLNISVGGMLLLLPQAVTERHVFEITAGKIADEKRRTKLVEVRWTRPLSVIGRTLHLTGVKVLFEPPLSPG